MAKYLGPKSDPANVATQADIPSAPTTASAGTITGTNAEGTSTSFARADHNHQIQAVGAFYGYRSAALNMLGNGNRILECDDERFDVSGWLDTNTNKGRYTPQLAGYYRFSATIRIAGGSSFYALDLFRNGSQHCSFQIVSNTPDSPRITGSALVYLNGTTDYVDVRLFHSTSGTNRAVTTGADTAYFCGEFVGSA